MTYSAWTGQARTTARAVDAAVTAARAGDADAFAEALADLRRGDAEALAVLLGAMTQELLERLHPDGLDSDDAEQVLAGCARVSSWYPPFDRDYAVLALIGALGVHDPDETPRTDGADVTAHGLLLIASLLPASGELAPLVESALRELHRAQTIELP
jgi:hypothetical protein